VEEDWEKYHNPSKSQLKGWGKLTMESTAAGSCAPLQRAQGVSELSQKALENGSHIVRSGERETLERTF